MTQSCVTSKGHLCRYCLRRICLIPDSFCPILLVSWPLTLRQKCLPKDLRKQKNKQKNPPCHVFVYGGTHTRVGEGRKRGWDAAWFVLSAKCQSVFARLSHMISLNTQGLVVHLLRPDAHTHIHTHPPSPLTPITTKFRSGGPASLPPTERI